LNAHGCKDLRIYKLHHGFVTTITRALPAAPIRLRPWAACDVSGHFPPQPLITAKPRIRRSLPAATDQTGSTRSFAVTSGPDKRHRSGAAIGLPHRHPL